jgi:nitrogen regulatory protein PII
MALVIYSNGIFEEYLPVEDTFNDQELVDMFKDYNEIRSFRLSEIPNCWLVWGEMDDPPDNEYSKLASEIVDEDVFSHVMFIHDSEINRNWNLTDDILYKSYSVFIQQVREYTKGLVEYIAHETQKEYEEAGTTSMIFLRAVGFTEDKRVLYMFNPDEQHEGFYVDGWNKFSIKIYEYLKDNFYKEPIEENKPLVIYADTKVIVIVEDEKVNDVISHVLQEFEKKENYEACSFISQVRDKWYERKTIPKEVLDPSIGPPKRRRGRPPKKKDNDEKAE